MTSDEEEVGGDFTVYECPGLAPVSYGLAPPLQLDEAATAVIVFVTVTMATEGASNGNGVIVFLLCRLERWK